MTKIGVHPLSLSPDHEGGSEFFSAFFPLGCLVAYAKVHNRGALLDAFTFGRITPTGTGALPGLLNELGSEPAVFLLSSYVWNHHVNMAFARDLKRHCPESLVIVGGPHVPRMPAQATAFFESNPWIDVAARHEGEITLSEILEVIARNRQGPADLHRVDLSSVQGIVFRKNGDLIRTADRPRAMDLSSFPSPYTTGEYDHWLKGRLAMPVETNRGCPYGCTFCDWGAATLSKIARMSMERVQAEIEYAAKNSIYALAFCDANFGILERDLDIVRFIIQMKDRYGYPRHVGYANAKNAKPRLLEIIKLLREAGLTPAAQISMQTIDEQVLANVERANIRTSEYRKMIALFHEEDIPAASDMMVGLPGQTFETCKKDLQFFFDHMVLAVVFSTSVMPNAPMADPDYQRKFSIKVGADGMVESTYSFTREEYAKMFELCLAYKLFVKLGLLKYLLYFVQREHGVKAMDFVARWLEKSAEAPDLYPISHYVRNQLIGRDYQGGRKDWLVLAWSDDQGAVLFDSLEQFYREILTFLEVEHGARLEGSDVEAVIVANRKVMPRKGRALPARVALEHDVAAYFADLRRLPSLDASSTHEPLVRRQPGHIELDEQPECRSYQHADITVTQGTLELASNLRV